MHARIENAIVVELIGELAIDGVPIALEDRYTPDFLAGLVEVPADVQVQEGWSYDANGFAPPPAPSAPGVPQSVTMRQARLALLAAGKLDDVDAIIAALPSPEREQAKIEWDYAATVDRQEVFTLMLADKLGLDAAALDALFVQATKL